MLPMIWKIILPVDKIFIPCERDQNPGIMA
jgi:hypothetical protein